MFGSKGREEAAVVVEFPEATQEQFEVFADTVSALVDGALVEFQDKPILGMPYLIVWFPDEGGSYNLIVDEGQALCASGEDYWVAD